MKWNMVIQWEIHDMNIQCIGIQWHTCTIQGIQWYTCTIQSMQ